MNCEEFWNGMPELDGLELGHASASHVNECAACAKLLDRQRALAVGLRKVAMDLRGMEAPAGLETRLLLAFRRQSTAVPSVLRMPRRSWLPVAISWVSAAAAIVAMVVFMVPRRQPDQPRHSSHNRPGTVELAVLQTPVEISSDVDGTGANDGFIPLPNAMQMGPNEDVNVVRVEVPRSAMMAVGIDVSDDRAAELVEADVMLGSDGLPRAVRFLDPSGYVENAPAGY
jgi:hypothetical protein